MPPRDQQVSCEIHVRRTIDSAARLSWVPLDPLHVERKAARLNASARFFFQVRFIKLSIANSTGQFLASSLGRTDASDATTLKNESDRSESSTIRFRWRCTFVVELVCTRVSVTSPVPTHTWPYRFVWCADSSPWTPSKINNRRYDNQWVPAR